MTATAFFSNNSMDCRLDVQHADGHHQHVLFENVSSMVNYCNNVGIVVQLGNCKVEN